MFFFRNLSSQDSRADIFQSAVYTASPLRPRQITHALCDLIPSTYVELEAPKPPDINFESVSYKLQPFKIHIAEYKPRCSFCQSNPDISLPIKSCLKKPKAFTSSISLPAEENFISNIELVNIKWNRAYDSPTDQMINKISNDLDFLLNRNTNKDIEIQEAPT